MGGWEVFAENKNAKMLKEIYDLEKKHLNDFLSLKPSFESLPERKKVERCLFEQCVVDIDIP